MWERNWRGDRGEEGMGKGRERGREEGDGKRLKRKETEG